MFSHQAFHTARHPRPHGIITRMEATRITALRHGETAWNVDAPLQGQLDIALNAHGHRQAALLGQALAARGDALHAIYSSDLIRAHDTARPLAAATGAPLHLKPALRERCFGNLQGHTFAQAQALAPQDAGHWRARTPDWTPPGAGGESLIAFSQRVLAQVQALAAAHLGEHIAIVTHGGVLDVLYRAAAGLDLQAARTWQLGNAAINRLLWTPEGGLTLVGWADTQHLETLRDETST